MQFSSKVLLCIAYFAFVVFYAFAVCCYFKHVVGVVMHYGGLTMSERLGDDVHALCG